jgi:ligand-binding sensor domain-containing protein/two-component sensor histidine kinase
MEVRPLLWGVWSLLLCFAGGCRNLAAQNFSYNWHKIDQSNGLSEMQNAFLTTDRSGGIWISSADGLNHFDGKNIEQHHFYLSNGQRDPIISSAVFQDASGAVWCTTAGGIHRMHNGQTDTWPISVRDTQATYHYAICLERDSLLWVNADGGLFVFNTITKKYRFLHDLSTTRCYPVIDSSGSVRALVVSRFDTGIEIIEYGKEGEFARQCFFQQGCPGKHPVARAYNLLVQADTLLWIPSDIGLIALRLADKTFKIYQSRDKINEYTFCDAVRWKNDFLWLTSIGGGIHLFSIKEEKFKTQLGTVWAGDRTHDVSKVNNLYVDPFGTLWLSNWNKEILYANFYSSKFQQCLQKKRPDLPTNEIIAMAAGPSGQIWCAVPEKGVFGFASEADFLSGEGQKTCSSCTQINNLFWDGNSNVWHLSKEKLTYQSLDKHVCQPFRQTNVYYRKMVSLADDCYLTMTSEGFECIEMSRNGYNATPLRSTGFAAINVIALFACQDGRLYASFIDNKIAELKITKNGLNLGKVFHGAGFVNDFVEDESGGFIWMASSAGLLKLKNNKIESIIDRQKLLLNTFNAILQDHHQNLWLSSNSGLFKYNPNTGEVKHYTESDGLQGLQFMLGSACKLSDGRLAFGGVNGLNIFHPDSVRDNPNPPIIHFTDWIVNDTGSISTSPEYLDRQSFSFNNRTLSFHFIGIDYTAPDEVRYKYRLKGFEKDTVEGGGNGFARYAQLPAGDYTFQVWAANSDGVWSTNPHELQFTILPPWYATWWARSLQVLLVLGLLYTFYQNRITQIRRKESERRKEAEFRQKEAESKQLAAELQNSVLRLQMNPHFIFNSMNSISSYILQKDIDTANQYLSRFAKLMRLILDLASKPLIPIADEIELLEQYMAAEAMRFENKFTWQVELDEALDPEEIMLPTMILQPFVENAIWHGFARKTTPGYIRIEFKKQDSSMVCTVEDNGIGRIESSKNKAEVHPSRAVQITEQRLQLIEKKSFPKTDLQIIDLYDEYGTPSGTKVEVKLPLDL